MFYKIEFNIESAKKAPLAKINTSAKNINVSFATKSDKSVVDYHKEYTEFIESDNSDIFEVNKTIIIEGNEYKIDTQKNEHSLKLNL